MVGIIPEHLKELAPGAGHDKEMKALGLKICALSAVVLLSSTGVFAVPQTPQEDDFGPVVRAYLGYLRNEQEVVDDRVSRREVSASYYRRNSNRIKALRQMAVRIARESQNDYLPELEAVARDELDLLFEKPPDPQSLQVGSVLRNTFRFLGAVKTSEIFYLFARLDPYEQSDLREQGRASGNEVENQSLNGTSARPATTRSRRVNTP